MVYDNRNLAYDLRLFEDDDIYATAVDAPAKNAMDKKSESKKQNTETESRSRHKRIRRRKNNFFKISAAIFVAVAIVLVVGLIIHGQVQLTELNQQIANARDTLSEQQSLYTQLEMKVDASVSTSVVEEYAQNDLGMSKVANSQKEFVSLSQGDKVEISQDNNKTIWESIADAVTSLWS